jgi:hypothetical protein
MKIILLSILLSTSFISFSQSLPEARIKYHADNTRITYPALIKHLTKENTYKIVYPNKLTYYTGVPQMQAEFMTFAYSDMSMKAKRDQDNPEIYIVIEATGIKNLVSKGIRKTPNGFVIDYTYNFPCKLLIQDNKGTTLYTIPVYSETDPLSAVYYKNLSTYFSIGFTPVYFVSEREASDFQGATKDLGRHVEKYAVMTIYKEMAKIVTALYNDYSEKRMLQYGDISNAEGVAEYTELNAASAQLKQAYDLLSDRKIEEATTLLKSARTVFEKYADNKTITLPVKNMTLYNLGWASLLTGDTKKGMELYAKQSPNADWHTGYGWEDMKVMAEFDLYRSRIREKMTQ